MVGHLFIRDEGRIHLSTLCLLPIHSFEHVMHLNLLESGSKARISNKDCLKETAYEARDARRISRLTVDDIIVYLLWVFIMERSFTRDNLADKDS